MVGAVANGCTAPQPANEHLLERLGSGVLLLNSAGALVFANKAARELMRNRHLTLLFRMRAGGGPHARRFDSALRAVISGKPCISMLLNFPTDRRTLRITFSSICSRNFGRFGGCESPDVAVMIFVSDATAESHTPADEVASVYGLTAAEARVAVAAARGVCTSEIAAELEISSNTVKTHLRRVYQKVGVRRQAELVGLMRELW